LFLIFAYESESGATRLGQFDPAADRAVALRTGQSLYELACSAEREGRSLAAILAELCTNADAIDARALAAEGKLRIPIMHPDPAHMLLTGTGLTHRASAESRDRMHAAATEGAETDTIRMYRLGEAGGRPAPGQVGTPPEWFYKGDASMLVAPGASLSIPDFAEDGGEETELAGIYLVGSDGSPRRIGFALANEFSDHVIEKKNYLYLAHSKLRQSAIGPMILIGELPEDVRGTTTITRGDTVVWQAPFASGDANMCHTIANLEHHHFKYDLFRRPGDLHVHYFGAATVSFGDGVRIEPGDRIAIASDSFGLPLVNRVASAVSTVPEVRPL
jgi:hypothetical protein